ncbi:MAG: gliding motility-associated C-terminal domain-containing protein [Spirochaetales bacterium]|nr:gliding motility-associated C-terminal domain-containing protein [Spirochaetales bacterium]
MKQKVYVLVVLITLASIPAFAYNPAPGSVTLPFDLFSPVFLAGGANSVAEGIPAASVLNPAAAGDTQRFTIDVSYLGLFGTEAPDSGWNAHAANGAFIWPTRAGVLSAGVRYLATDFDAIELGSHFGAHVAFAKDLFPKLLVGLGLQGQYGPEDWGLAADLGFIHLPGDVRVLKDLRWGIAMRGLGKEMVPADASPAPSYTGLYPSFTPAAGLSFDLLQREKLIWSWHSDVSLPSFQNLTLNLGTELAIVDRVFLHLGSTIAVDEFGSGDMRVPVSFGASVKLGASVKESQSEVKITAAAAPLYSNIWGAGAGVNLAVGLIDRQAPEIMLNTDQQYISPNFDGIQDDLVKSLSITDQRFVKGFRFLVLDEQGNQVREIVNKDERPENVTFKNVLARLAYVKTGITVPEGIRWDGRSDSGAVVSDGTYTFKVEAWDDNDNRGESASGTVIVDNTVPQVTAGAPYLIFSPNNDGNKDTLPIEQNGSQEVLWRASVSDAGGQEVASFSWENSEPGSFAWDGTNDEGILSPDGVYSYRIGATDLAGNTSETSIGNILIDTQATPINITISDSYFSPNGDGSKDSVQFTLGVPVTTGIEKWQLQVVGEAGGAGRTFSGTRTISDTIVFDGRGDQGNVLAEDTYTGHLEVLYENGNNPKAVSPQFTIDLTPPSATVSADLAIFSPDGDGNKDVVTLYQESSEETLWSGTIEDIDGRSVRTYSWRGRADAKIEWGGRADEGELVADGIYFYSLDATDRAGNAGGSKKVRFEINTQATEVFVSADLSLFSPNADGVKDRITIQPRLKVTEGVSRYELRILDASGKILRRVEGQNRPPQDFAWDGLDGSGRRLPDGDYQAELILDYQKGDHHEVRTSVFKIDTGAPTIEVSAQYSLFSPDGDELKDKLPISQSSSEESLWEGEFRNAKGQVVRSFYWKGKAQDFQWDGKDENGNKIPDGSYSYTIRSTDQAGNSVSRELRGLQIDTRVTSVFVTASGDGFSPNGDDFADSMEFKPYVGLAEGIQSWSLEMVHEQEGVQKTFSGSGAVPAVINWDGRSNGSLAREGVYTAVMTVGYLKGNRPQAKSTPFKLDVSPPQIDLSVSPQPFSPDNDGVDDELFITMKVTDLSPVEEWRLEILDPVGSAFLSYTGKGMPSERILWDGLSDTGELVQSAEDYTLRVTIRDKQRNALTAENLIPVDVLVIREGDKLKIRIASITFPPNSADLAAVTDIEKAARNDKTLRRLFEIFKKYSAYQIRIEGHANITRYWSEAEARKENEEELIPLSLDRAEAVKRALVMLGLDGGRISVVGLGGSAPIVPFDDEENRWKNRRVEFILIKR